MKLKEALTYVATISTNLLFAFLFTLLFFKGDNTNFIFCACGTILVSLITVAIIAKKFNYKLDIFAYNITDVKYLIINSIFIGNLFSIPISMFVSLAL